MSEAGQGGSRVLAFLISFVLPSAGHTLRGRRERGFVFLGAMIAAILSVPLTRTAGIGLAVAVWLAAALDAAIVKPGPRVDWEYRLTALTAPIGLIVFQTCVVRSYWVEGFKIPAGSMAPTLLVGDHLMVARYDRSPERGDVVVFTYPKDPRKDFVKRVVAVAGDEVEVIGDRVIVNGEPLPQDEERPCKYDDLEETGQWQTHAARCVEESTESGRTYTIAFATDGGPYDYPPPGEPRPYVVPDGHIFVLGDNRYNSSDSRVWGPVPLGNLKGRALFIWWSKGKDGLRSERINKTIR